jgi:dephospho-CoA kinase
MKLIVGLVGRIGCGKSTVGEHLKDNYSAVELRYSGILTEVLETLSVPVTRENLQALGKNLRETFGEDVLVNAMRGKLSDAGKDVIIVDGIRYPNEVEMLREFDDTLLLFVDVPARVRYDRAVKRGQRGEAGITFKEFTANEGAETERHIDSLRDLADHVIDNSGAPEDLIEKVEAIIREV